MEIIKTSLNSPPECNPMSNRKQEQQNHDDADEEVDLFLVLLDPTLILGNSLGGVVPQAVGDNPEDDAQDDKQCTVDTQKLSIRQIHSKLRSTSKVRCKYDYVKIKKYYNISEINYCVCLQTFNLSGKSFFSGFEGIYL